MKKLFVKDVAGLDNGARLRLMGWIKSRRNLKEVTFLDLRDYGIVPHGGIGMGIERAVRYALKLPHIRYTTSFPRLMGRTPNP